MKRIISLILSLVMAAALFACNKMPTVDKNVKPEEHFSRYKTLTDLYGTPWRDTLKELDVDIQEINADGLTNVGIPMKETYAGVVFDIALSFSGENAHLRRVEYSATYQYPDEEEQLLKDLVKLNRELISDLGDPSDISMVFNWAEKRMGETWNRNIPFWQDTQVLKRLLDDGYSGYMLFWNLSSVAPEHIKALDIEHSLSIYVNIDQNEGTADIIINY